MLQQVQEAVLQLQSKLSENGSFHYLIDTYLVVPQANKLIYFQWLEQQDSKKSLLFPRGKKKKKNRALLTSPFHCTKLSAPITANKDARCKIPLCKLL